MACVSCALCHAVRKYVQSSICTFSIKHEVYSLVICVEGEIPVYKKKTKEAYV